MRRQVGGKPFIGVLSALGFFDQDFEIAFAPPDVYAFAETANRLHAAEPAS
jgi:hypothetical protein